jgi:hypothetical protein
MKGIILFIFIFLNNAFCANLYASDIDPTNTFLMLGLLASIVLTIILILLGYRKAINILRG